MTLRTTAAGLLSGRALDSPPAMILLGLLYSLAWMSLLPASQFLWFLPAGLRLGALWLTPTRRWVWLAAAEWLTLAAIVVARGWTIDRSFPLIVLMPWLIYAAIVHLVRGTGQQPRIDDPPRMLRLFGAGLLAAALVSPILQASLPDAGVQAGVAGMFSLLYGDFLGQLVVAPLLILLARPDLRRRIDLGLWIDIAAQFLFTLTVFWLIRERSDLQPTVLLLAFAPLFFVAFRQGWEGAAISLGLVGLLLEALLHRGAVPTDVRLLQLGLAVVGGGALLVGAASSELRRSNERLAARHRELAEINASLGEAAGELRSVSQRLVRLEEQGQRELAVELDYELGRSIQALGTRISLAFKDTRDEQMLRLLESMREQVREMQDSLRRVLRQLRPYVLDSHGLREAVGYGPLRDMLDDAGVSYETAFYGRIEALKDDAQTAVYRICQAAVREACRSQASRRVLVRVDVLPGEAHRLQVQVQVDIEASPYPEFPVEFGALPAITDRVIAQEGQYWVEPLSPGVRHCVRFHEDSGTLL